MQYIMEALIPGALPSGFVLLYMAYKSRELVLHTYVVHPGCMAFIDLNSWAQAP